MQNGGGNIKQDPSYRLVNDTEKNTWNNINITFPDDKNIFSKDKKLNIRHSDDYLTIESKLKNYGVKLFLSETQFGIQKTDLSGNILTQGIIRGFGENVSYPRYNDVKYFSSTWNGTSFVTLNIQSDLGLSDFVLPTYPAIIATVNTNIGGFYVESCQRNSDTEIAIIFNKVCTVPFILAISFSYTSK